MSTRYKGSVLSATAATNSQSAAVGIWRPNEVLQAVNASLWPLGITYDPYFKYVTLLLHGDGTNGAQNNTFLDSSTNNFTITRNGNTTQGTFTPYGPNWSNYFNGASDWLTATANTAFALSSGDFTIECWAFITSVPNAYNAIYDNRLSGSSAAGFWITVTSGRVITCRNNTDFVSSGSNLLTLNQWNHIAVVRSGSTMSIYLNGTSVGSATIATNWTDNAFWMNRVNDVTTLSGVQYISNFRIVKGTAVYTTTFTPSTTPLTAVSGTSLLTCQSNRFIDNSTNAFAITRGGSPSIQRFSPFSPPTAYSTSVIGGSGYFDGSGDYLSTANGVTNVGTGDVCVECFVYYTGTYADYNFIFDSRAGSPFTDGFAISINITNGYFYFSQASQEILTSIVCQKNVWNHVCVTRQSGVFRMFINGVLGGTYTSSSNLSSTSNRVGWYYGATASYQFPGYISDLRATKSAVPTTYQTSSTTVGAVIFTPPTAPLTTTSQGASGTSLLLSYTNAGIYDNAMMNDLETVGDAQISTSVVKFGTGSMAFDGTGDYLKQPASVNLSFGSGDFTLECWAYFTSVANFPTLTDSRVTSASTTGFNLGLSTAKVQIYSTSQILIGATALSANTWYHIAVTRASGTLKIWLNGVQDATVANSTNWSDTTFLVGATPTPTNYMTGYIDDLRVTKGYARYTATFTPPTAAFPNQ